MNTSVAVIAVV